MKKLAILSLMVISALSVDAQRKRTRTATSQGNVVVRLGMGVNHVKDDPDYDPITRSTTINFNPTVGYMVIDNLELGVDFDVEDYSMENVTRANPQLEKTVMDGTSVGFGVYVQKYFPLNNWFALTGEANLGLRTGTFNESTVLGAVTTPVSAASGNTNSVGGGVNFGFSFTPYNALALQANIAGIGIMNEKTDYEAIARPNVNRTEVGFNVWRQPYNMSVVFFFGRGLWKK